MLEKDIERRFVRAFERRGAMAWKFTSPGRQGVPDRVVILPGGRIIFVELKTETGKLSPIQKTTIARLRAQGCEVRVVYGMEQAMALVEEVLPSEVQTIPVPGAGDAVDS